MALNQFEPKKIYLWIEYPPLCFTANTAGSTVKLRKVNSPTDVTLKTSTDGATWTNYTIGTAITLTNIGDKVYFRNTSTTTTGFSPDSSNFYQFQMSGSISASGDITTLINKNGTDTVSNYCFYRLFEYCSSLTTAPILLPTTLGQNCYHWMFHNCTGLITAPELPATTLANDCYYYMFQGCTALTTCSSLPATTLANECYLYMFSGCTSLTTLPKLPATTLSSAYYQFMFNQCSNIKLSTTQTGIYQTAYRIPTTGTGTNNNSLGYMFYQTGGTFTGTPSINTTYYTSNTLV